MLSVSCTNIVKGLYCSKQLESIIEGKMRFSTITSLLALLCSTPSYGFSHPTFANRNLSRTKRGNPSSSALRSITSSVVEIETAPIAGMKPGTSGLRKKVDVWQGADEANKYYVENFIQSLIDTAKESNNGEQLDT